MMGSYGRTDGQTDRQTDERRQTDEAGYIGPGRVQKYSFWILAKTVNRTKQNKHVTTKSSFTYRSEVL